MMCSFVKPEAVPSSEKKSIVYYLIGRMSLCSVLPQDCSNSENIFVILNNFSTLLCLKPFLELKIALQLFREKRQFNQICYGVISCCGASKRFWT